jgi:hypothetical protein
VVELLELAPELELVLASVVELLELDGAELDASPSTAAEDELGEPPVVELLELLELLEPPVVELLELLEPSPTPSGPGQPVESKTRARARAWCIIRRPWS